MLKHIFNTHFKVAVEDGQPEQLPLSSNETTPLLKL